MSIAQQTPATRPFSPPDEVAEYLKVLADIDAAEEEVKRLKAIASFLEERIVESWAACGKQSEKRDGRTIYRSRDLYVNVPAKNREAVVEACRELGFEELVKTEVPTTSLKARFREWLGEDSTQPPPEELLSLVNVHESFSLRVRKG